MATSDMPALCAIHIYIYIQPVSASSAVVYPYTNGEVYDVREDIGLGHAGKCFTSELYPQPYPEELFVIGKS